MQRACMSMDSIFDQSLSYFFSYYINYSLLTTSSPKREYACTRTKSESQGAILLYVICGDRSGDLHAYSKRSASAHKGRSRTRHQQMAADSTALTQQIIDSGTRRNPRLPRLHIVKFRRVDSGPPRRPLRRSTPPYRLRLAASTSFDKNLR